MPFWPTSTLFVEWVRVNWIHRHALETRVQKTKPSGFALLQGLWEKARRRPTISERQQEKAHRRIMPNGAKDHRGKTGFPNGFVLVMKAFCDYFQFAFENSQNQIDIGRRIRPSLS